MSAVSGLTSKGENKSKQKYQSLNINNLYKGKSLENPKTSVAPKHGLQTLGKVGAGRRMPPPANLPSLKSQISGNPNINLVPTGGPGWGSGKEEDSSSGTTPPLQTSSSGRDGQPLSGQQKPSSSLSIPSLTSSNVTTDSGVGAIACGLAAAALTAASKTWSAVTASASEESGPDKSYLAQQSPFFPQEFPKLDGGNAPTDGQTTKPSAPDTSYGPGPSLRPQTEGSWGRGTLPQTQSGPNANQPLSAGNGGSGQPASPPLPNDQSVQNLQQVSRGLYPQPGAGLPQQRALIPGAVPIHPGISQPGIPLIPGQTPMNYPNQYRMMTPFPPHMAYPRGAYPNSGYPPQGYPPPPHGAINTRQPYFPDARGQRMDDESSGRPSRPAPPIITDKDLKGFDDILENDVQKGWAAANTEIDYNAKLVFSDDEDSQPMKESTNYGDIRDKSEGKLQKDWERREHERGGDDRGPPKYRGPAQQWTQAMPANARVNNYEYSQQPASQSAQSYSRQQIHSNYSHSRHNRSEPIVADDDEMWRQKSRQQSDEMAAAVIRARQRREEEEKKIERSRQAAHEKLKALEEKSLDKDSVDFDQSSRHSSESRDDKLSTRETRNANFSAAAKQYPKNVPPRFQKQAELMRQTHQQSTGGQTTQSPPYDQRFAHSSNRMPSEVEPRDSRSLANNSQPPIKAPLMADSSRSDSQISSGHESYDSERDGRTTEHDSKDKLRQRSSHSGSDSNNWRAVQTQRHSINESKETNDISILRPIVDKENEMSRTLDRDGSKKANDENEYSEHKSRPDVRETKPKDETTDSKEIFGEKRTLIERQESSQSSHSDRRSTSSKEDRFARRYERLDWAAECENMASISNYGAKREHRSHRHVPITQKQFESITEPIKKNFTPLKRINASVGSSVAEELKDSSVDKSKESSKANETLPQNPPKTYAENVSQSESKSNSLNSAKVDSLKDENRVESGAKKERESDRHYERHNREKESTKKDLSKDEKNLRKSHSNRYESHSSRGRYSGPAFRGRGREYRRSRQSSEKSSTNESKLTASPGHSRSKSSKSRRKSISDESYVSEDINRKETPKPESDKSSSVSGSNIKDDKPEEDREILTSDTVISSSATATVVPTQRGDLSRRGRGVVAFKNSTRGLPRAYVPSNYGPPPSRAAFGDGLSTKSEYNKNLDQNRNERNSETKYTSNSSQNRMSSSKSAKDEINCTSYSSSQSNQFHDNNRNSLLNSRKTGVSGANRSAGNTTNSSNNNNRSEALPPRFQKRHNRGSQGRGDRTRQSNERSGSSHQFESDVTNNEEWETASESSDVAERSERKANKKNSFPEHRNDSRNYSRKSDNKRNEYPRGRDSNNAGNQSAGYRGGNRNRNSGTGVSASRSANGTQQRNGTIGSSNISDNITVCSLSEVTLDNPNAVEEALTDIKNRNRSSSDLLESQLYSSETEDGFQTVSYKKRNRLNQGNDNKKFKQELSPKSKCAVRNRQSKLAPRFAKQKESFRLNTISDEAFTSALKLSEDIKSLTIDPKSSDIAVKSLKEKTISSVSSIPVPNAWSRPLSHCSVTTAISPTITTNTKTVVKTTNSITHDIQALSVSSKSSSFDQHDSGIDVSDQPPSTASSQRSSPSNDDNKLITTTAKVQTPETRTDSVADIDTAKPMCTVIFENTRFKEENKVLAQIAPAKSPTAKEMFANTNSVTNNVTETTRPTQSIAAPKKNESVLIEEFPINEKNNQSSNVAKVVGMQRTNVLPTDDLNMKIASVKKVWESPSVTTSIDSTNDNSKNVLLKTFDETKITNESHGNESVHTMKVSKGYQSVEQTAAKVDYSVDSINSLNKSKQQAMTYSTLTPSQMTSNSYVSSHQSQPSLISSQHLLLNAISSPPLAESLRPLSGVQQQFSVHNMATSPAISTPPTMLYNTQVAAHNVYQAFGAQIESIHQTQLPAVMAQFGPQPTSGHYGQPILQHQQNQLSQANIFMAHQLAAQPSATAEQYKQFNAVAQHQQSLAKSLLNNQFVHQNNSSLQQTLTNANSWTTPAGHTQANSQSTSYYPQSSSVGSALPAHQQHFAFQSQPSLGLMSAQSSQAAAALVQQSYRANPLSMGRNTGVDATNSMAANLRNMFAGNIVNDMKIGTSVNATIDARNNPTRSASFTYSQSQASSLQQLQQQQHQMYANQKYANRAILPIYAQQMLGQAAISGRPNSASMLTSNVNSANSYTTPIQRPKLNRNNQSYVKSSHPPHHQQIHQQSHQQTHQQTHQLTHQPIHPTHQQTHQALHQQSHQPPHQQQQHLQSHQPPHPLPTPPLTAGQSAQLSSAQQAKMRQEAVRQTQSFFAQSSSLTSNKNDLQNESQSCAEVSNESLTKECVSADTTVKNMNEENNKINSIDKTD